MSSPFSFPSVDPTHLLLPPFHSSDVIPAILLVYGMAVAFLGFRLSRFFCFTLGFVLGLYFIDQLFISQTAIRHAGLPLIVITLVSLVSAVTLLLLHELTLSAVLGYILADFLIAADNGRVLGWGIGRWIAIIAVQAAVLAAGRKNWVSSLPLCPPLHNACLCVYAWCSLSCCAVSTLFCGAASVGVVRRC